MNTNVEKKSETEKLSEFLVDQEADQILTLLSKIAAKNARLRIDITILANENNLLKGKLQLAEQEIELLKGEEAK